MLREIVRFAVLGCALAAAIWMLARYFAVLRPRAGTTEWIGRLTPPPWQPVSGCPLHGMDAPAALLLCLAVTGLRLLEHRLRFHAMPVTPEALLPVLFAGLAAGCAHLLLRRLVGGMLPALSGALFFGLLQDGSPAVTAALLGYVLWRTAKRCGGGWIVLSVVCFAAGLLKEDRADPEGARDHLMATMACKAAIKGGQKNGPAELQRVAEAVMSGQVKYCPHGRPVAIEWTRGQLEKLFRRA